MIDVGQPKVLGVTACVTVYVVALTRVGRDATYVELLLATNVPLEICGPTAVAMETGDNWAGSAPNPLGTFVIVNTNDSPRVGTPVEPLAGELRARA